MDFPAPLVPDSNEQLLRALPPSSDLRAPPSVSSDPGSCIGTALPPGCLVAPIYRRRLIAAGTGNTPWKPASPKDAITSSHNLTIEDISIFSADESSGDLSGYGSWTFNVTSDSSTIWLLGMVNFLTENPLPPSAWSPFPTESSPGYTHLPVGAIPLLTIYPVFSLLHAVVLVFGAVRVLRAPRSRVTLLHLGTLAAVAVRLAWSLSVGYYWASASALGEIPSLVDIARALLTGFTGSCLAALAVAISKGWFITRTTFSGAEARTFMGISTFVGIAGTLHAF
ncbi:hypothetical protein BC828DRAFT_397096 [Blastocladiella britannica]|nr:hypothetical protein BC828DRAFT_397096 [Blastocladiella britannica]